MASLPVYFLCEVELAAAAPLHGRLRHRAAARCLTPLSLQARFAGALTLRTPASRRVPVSRLRPLSAFAATDHAVRTSGIFSSESHEAMCDHTLPHVNRLVVSNSNRRCALGGDAGGRRATLPAVPCLVRAARAEGENLHSLRGVLDTAFPEIGGPVRAAAHPALPSFPEPIETSA